MHTSAAQLLTIAAAWWSQAAGPPPLCPDGVKYRSAPLIDNVAEATLGKCVITLGFGFKDISTRYRCKIMLHEYGHAAYDLEHEEGTIMSQSYDNDMSETPGVCWGLDRVKAHV